MINKLKIIDIVHILFYFSVIGLFFLIITLHVAYIPSPRHLDFAFLIAFTSKSYVSNTAVFVSTLGNKIMYLIYTRLFYFNGLCSYLSIKMLLVLSYIAHCQNVLCSHKYGIFAYKLIKLNGANL